MGGAGSEFLGQDRGHQLSGRIERKGAFDRDQGVVHGGQARRAAPGQTAPVGPYDVVEMVGWEFDLGEYLHGIRGARRGGDRTARGLGDEHPMGGDDRHDEHAGAVARYAADAVLVGDQGFMPVQLFAAARHSARQRQHLIALHPGLGTGDQEGRHLDLGIAVLHDVAGDRLVVGEGEPLTGDLTMHRMQGRGRFGMCDRGLIVFRQAELLKGLQAQAELPGRGDRRILDHVQHGQNRSVAVLAADLDLRQCLKALAAIDPAIAMQVGHVLLVGVDGDTPEPQRAFCLFAHFCLPGRTLVLF